VANENITEVTLLEIELYQNGERADSETFNRPIIQLRDNITKHQNMLTQIYNVLGSDNLNLDTMLEIADNITTLNSQVQYLEINGVENVSGSNSLFNGSVEIAENFVVKGTSVLEGETTITDNLNVDGTGTFNSDVGINQSLEVGTTLLVNDTLTVTNDIYVEGELKSSNNIISVSSNIASTKDITTTGKIRSLDGEFDNTIIVGGETVATQNWSDIQYYSKATTYTKGEVDLIVKNSVVVNTYRYIGNGATTTYNFQFKNEGLSVFVNGIMADREEYILYYNDGDGESTTGEQGVKVVFESAPETNKKITFVVYPR